VTVQTFSHPLNEGPTRPPRVTLPRVIASEWTKLRSLRSTWWTLLIAVVAMIGLSALFATSIAAAGVDGFGPGGPLAALDGVAISLNGVMLAQLAFGILGVLMITGEYGSGTITASLAAVPQRWPLLAAKTVILTGLTLTVGLAASLSAFSIGQGLLAGSGMEVALSDPDVSRAVGGAGVYLTLVTILGLGLGALLRHRAGGFAVLTGYALATLTVATLLLLRRDT